MPLSPHEAATMLGVPHTADAATIDAVIARLRVDYEAQVVRAVTPEIATFWRNRIAKLDEARDVLRKAADDRLRAAQEAAEEAEREAAAAEDPAAPDDAAGSHGASNDEARAEWERLRREMAGAPPDERPGLPWEASSEPATARAVATARRVLLEPNRAFGEMRLTGGLAAPLWYALLVGLPAATVATFLYFLLQVAMNPQEFNNMSVREAAAVGIVVMPLYVAIVYPLSLFINAGLQHASLLLLEKAPQPFETTFRAVAYAFGTASTLQWIPIVGLLASGIAQIVLNIIALARAHDLPMGRAAVVYFLPMLTCCACFVAIITAGTWVGSTFTR